MANFWTGLGLVFAAFGLAVCLVVWFERRATRRYENWTCPSCGNRFGKGSFGFWTERTVNIVDGGNGFHVESRSGPLMTCQTCGREFRYQPSGELHPQQPKPHRKG